MKKKATDRARKKSIPCFLPSFGQYLLQLIKTVISTCLLSKETSASHVPQQHKNLQLLLLGERDLLSPCVRSDTNRGALVLKI